MTRIPIFGGRWQPFHRGHEAVVNSLLATHPRVILAIVNPDPENPFDRDFERFRPEWNPFNYWERSWLLWQLCIANDWTCRVDLVPSWHPRKSLARERNYLPAQRSRYWFIPDLDEAEEAKAADFEALGERVELGDEFLPDTAGASSTRIRRKVHDPVELGQWLPETLARHLNVVQARGYIWACTDEVEFPIVCGRFQPLHNGHVWLIKRALQDYSDIVIGITHPEPNPLAISAEQEGHAAHNPFTYWERLQMIDKWLCHEGLRERCHIVPCWPPRWHDQGDPAFLPRHRTWLLANAGGSADALSAGLFGASELVRIYEDVPKAVSQISSSLVRQKLADAAFDELQALVPPVVLDYLDEQHAAVRARALNQRHPEAVERYFQLYRRGKGARDDREKAEGAERFLARLQDRLAGLDRVIADHITSRSQVASKGEQYAQVVAEAVPIWQQRQEELRRLERRFTALESRSDERLSDLIAELNQLGRQCLGPGWTAMDE